MSFEALASLREVSPPSSSALLLLFILAEYAGADGVCFPSQETLSSRSRLSVRAVRDNLALLVGQGLIVTERRARKDGSRASDAIRLLYYVPEQPAERPRPQRKEQPAKSAGCELSTALGDSNAETAIDNRQISPVDNRQISQGQPAMIAGLTSFEPVTEAITSDARAVEDCLTAIEAAYPRKGLGWSNRHAARLALEGLADEGFDIGLLPAAAARYAADPLLAKREYGPVKLERWLSEGRYRGWLGGEGDEAAPGATPTWLFPDKGLRDLVIGVKSVGFAVSYLDRAAWDAKRRVITPATGPARQALTAPEMRDIWASQKVTIGEKGT